MTTVATASTACTVCRRGRYFNLTITTDPATGEITTTTPSCLQCPLGSVSPGGPFFTANNSGPVCSPCPGASTTNRTGSAHCTSTCYSLGLPPALELGFWNESCLSTPIGGNCAARCPAGYQPGSSSAPPPPPSACTIDPARGLVWSQPAGSCEKATCYSLGLPAPLERGAGTFPASPHPSVVVAQPHAPPATSQAAAALPYPPAALTLPEAWCGVLPLAAVRECRHWTVRGALQRCRMELGAVGAPHQMGRPARGPATSSSLCQAPCQPGAPMASGPDSGLLHSCSSSSQPCYRKPGAH
ncbi:hypothetical protein OEZ86_013172 [Tetradesmus obliquus]|nr:hypothetical protein OEZ86_013172 [Tetradesmus obliquus]